ncbi:hypothetical protein SmJEL517_g05185 [Synchytrium microbalum]|uniref:Plastocyanin-like domain-containing protein n=1 Tax=Synchytrium microbalum TaxID=1806994 RepID=A0A507BX99_9FUNG|nr:uncharacterized protein SmJEL517_g05185 [Synchytrium microbalum]TPX31479.1 hypothetical protein SmJEL517_g05185 [Synchytrium microbalum]
MRQFTAIVTTSLLVFASLTQAVYDGSWMGAGSLLYAGPTLAQPTTITSSSGSLSFTLTVDSYAFNGYISFNTRAYYYNGVGSVPGPTWHVKPGDTVTVTLVNNLGSNTDAGIMNTLRSPNTTNLHTHGMQIDPSVDNVFITVAPGGTHTYTYVIPSDHPTGCFWYHSHYHGSSALQVMGGLIGAIYVDAADTSSAALNTLATYRRILMVLQHLSMSSINPSTDPFKVKTYVDLTTSAGSTLPVGATYVNSSVQDIYMVNGQFQPTFSATTGEQFIVDLVNAVGDHYIEFDIRESIGASSVTTHCDMSQIAIDSIYLSSMRSVSYVVLPPAGRTSVIITCRVGGTYYLQSYPDLVLRPDVTANETRFYQNLATLTVTGTTTTSTLTTISFSTIPRPSHMSDLQSTTAASKWTLGIDQTGAGNYAWLGIGSNCTLGSFGRATEETTIDQTYCQYVAFPGEQGTSGQYRHTSKLGTVEELDIWGRGGSAHPIHMHVTHLQIVSFYDASTQSYNAANNPYVKYYGQLGDWRDTVPALPGKTTVRYTMTRYTGEIVVHCHFLAHEDTGMMSTIYVSPNTQACTYPSTCSSSGAYSRMKASTVRDEFRRHRDAAPEYVDKFILEWKQYRDNLARDLPSIHAGIAATNAQPVKNLDKGLLDNMSDQQIGQLYTLRETVSGRTVIDDALIGAADSKKA